MCTFLLEYFHRSLFGIWKSEKIRIRISVSNIVGKVVVVVVAVALQNVDHEREGGCLLFCMNQNRFCDAIYLNDFILVTYRNVSK